MKNKFLSIVIPLLFSTSSTFAWWTSGTEANPAIWSTSGQTSGNTVNMELYSAQATQSGQNYFVFDQDVTFKTLRSVWQSSNQVVSMAQSGGGFSTITLDAADFKSNGVVQLLALRGTEDFGQNSLTITNGTLKFINSDLTYTPTGLIRLIENSESTANPKIITFGADSSFLSEINVQISGSNTATYPNRSTVNFNGIVSTASVSGSNTVYNEFLIKRENSSTSYGVNVNFGATSTANIGRLTLDAYSNLNIAAGAVLNVNTVNQSYAVDSNNIYIAANSTATVNGSLIVSSKASMHAFNVAGNLKIGQTGSISANSGGYRNVLIQSSGVVESESTIANSINAGDGIRMNGGKLIIRTENTIKDQIVWIYSSATSSMDLYGKVRAGALCFVNNGSFTINFYDNAELWLTNFTVNKGGGWADYLDSTNTLTLVGFENYKLHVGSYKAEDDLSRIFAEGFEAGSFRWEADSLNGGYWLVANAIPEPSTVAAIFGALAMVLAISRKKK